MALLERGPNLPDSPRQGRMTAREALLQAIAGLAAAGVRPDDIDVVAIRLSSAHPQSGIPLDEICRLIEQAVAPPKA